MLDTLATLGYPNIPNTVPVFCHIHNYLDDDVVFRFPTNTTYLLYSNLMYMRHLKEVRRDLFVNLTP